MDQQGIKTICVLPHTSWTARKILKEVSEFFYEVREYGQVPDNESFIYFTDNVQDAEIMNGCKTKNKFVYITDYNVGYGLFRDCFFIIGKTQLATEYAGSCLVLVPKEKIDFTVAAEKFHLIFKDNYYKEFPTLFLHEDNV